MTHSSRLTFNDISEEGRPVVEEVTIILHQVISKFHAKNFKNVSNCS